MKRDLWKFLVVTAVLCMAGCNAFMHGYTWNKAVNTYYLVTGDKDNFGDRRIGYNKGFYKHSALGNFLNCNCNSRGLPDFIYEYTSDANCRGIKLFYMKLDSVFVFEEPIKHNLNSVQKEARQLNENEILVYERLKQKK